MNRRSFLKKSALNIAGLAAGVGGLQVLNSAIRAAELGQKPNVVMICVDDLHPYVAKGRFPYIKTPAIDKLIKDGRYFSNAVCNTPVCNPSRSSFFSGLYPHTTGAYLNGSDGWNRTEILMKIRNIPECFKDNGYITWGGGKILHNPLSKERESGMWDNYPVYKGGFKPFPEDTGKHYGSRFRSIEAWTGPDSDFPDCVNADGAMKFLKKHHDKPFLLYYGLWRPHSPYTAPKRFFELYNESDFDFPEGRLENDLDDVPELGRLLTDGLTKFRKEGMDRDTILKKFLYAYAANTSFADWNVGRVLEALEKSRYAVNTIVIFFSDNGFHTTEKQRWGKATLWDLSANISLIVKAPDIKPSVSEATVSLVDLYPTLIDYCSLKKPNQQMDGVSFKQLLKDPNAQWNQPSFTSYGIRYSSVRNKEYRYIQYPDSSEELYKYQADPLEFRNLADNLKYESIKQELKKFIPKQWHDSTGGRLEVPHDYDKVMRPRSRWDRLPTSS
jgi:arylsulfatase A-like enzyme